MDKKIVFPKNKIEVSVGDGETLLDAIRRAGLPIEAVCSGRGTCGKCRVRVNGAERLACETTAADGMIVEILSSSGEQEILTGSGVMKNALPPSGKTAIAIDIGTTTVVVKALDTGSGKEICIRAFANPQRIYGADVLSRINSAIDDASTLSGLIRAAVDQAVQDILCDDVYLEYREKYSREDQKKYSCEKIVIAGNTTMMYLLLNLRCRSLGLVPFEPEYTPGLAYSYSEIFGKETLSCPVLIYPFISAFVGGDIVSGLVNIERHLESGEAPSYMLVDMGTNGEIAFRNGERLITTSTAAGPALEGGNISCGMSSLPGAIYESAYEGNGDFSYKTIGGRPAAGICGSGVISLMATLIQAGLVSESGAFTDTGDSLAESSEQGPAYKGFVIAEAGADGGERIVFTQKDVREVQLAKGAIRAGIDILMEEMGETPRTLYLAGGFGQNINLESSILVGLIPEGLAGRIRLAGNTALGGCADACMEAGPAAGPDANTGANTTTDPDASLPSLSIISAAEEINLGSHKDFNDKFMETMMFEQAVDG